MITFLKKIFLFCISIVVLFIIGLHVYEKQNFTVDIESNIGANIGGDRNTYENTDWETHRTYLSTFNFKGKKIRYIDRGDKNGQVIVLIHGTPTHSRLRRKMIPLLVEDGRRVIAPDLLGFGASDRADNHNQLLRSSQSMIVREILSEANINTYSIVGHDQGSLVVRDIITKEPDAIDHLFILNSIFDERGFLHPKGFGKENIRTTFTGRAMGSKVLGRIFANAAFAGGLYHPMNITQNNIDGYLIPLLQGKNDTYYDFITHFDEIKEKLPIRHEKMKKNDIPTTIIWGKQDKILVGERQIPLIQEILGVEDENVYLLEEGNHFIPEENHNKIVEVINFPKR